ncbi:hypothetical protein [Streptomyces syringium]|uniref:hypothetical protein n=1 Tax=Streptomyces syringium TaxID=76729 RepID=UPI00341E0EB3
MRAALEADEDVPEGADFKGVVHLVAAIGLGAQDVGADALAEASAASGWFGLTAEDWAQMLGAVERGESPPVDWGLLRQGADMLEPVQRAGDEQLLQARAVLLGLRMFYRLYAMHALFMPDTGACRAAGEDHFAEGLAVCLEPLFDGLYETLMEQLAADPGPLPDPRKRDRRSRFHGNVDPDPAGANRKGPGAGG